MNLLHVRGAGETERSGEVFAIGVYSAATPKGLAPLPTIEKAPTMSESVGTVTFQQRKTNQYIRPATSTGPLNSKRILRLLHKIQKKEIGGCGGDREGIKQ